MDAFWWLLIYLFAIMLGICLGKREKRKMDRLFKAGEADLKLAQKEFAFWSRLVHREKTAGNVCGECAVFRVSVGREVVSAIACRGREGVSANMRACKNFQCAHPDTHEFPDGDILCAICGERVSHRKDEQAERRDPFADLSSDEIYHKMKFVCPGPSRVSNQGAFGKVSALEYGKKKTIAECMRYPDCGCGIYDAAVKRWEDAEEREAEQGGE